MRKEDNNQFEVERKVAMRKETEREQKKWKKTARGLVQHIDEKEKISARKGFVSLGQSQTYGWAIIKGNGENR